MTATETAIEEVRESRNRMSRECGHDPAKLIAYLKQYSREHSSEIREYGATSRTSEPQPA